MEKSRKNTCPFCGDEFSSKDGIAVYIEEQRYLACPKCGRTKRSRIFNSRMGRVK